MQANALGGTIVIVKDAVPDDAQDFSFLVTGPNAFSEAFFLDDDADSTLGNSASFDVPAGNYTALEQNIPTGWELTGLVCEDPNDNSSTNTGTATASIDLDPGETVTCTYTDTRLQGSISVSKSGPEKSKVGDPARYTVVITNTGPITLYRQSITDSLAGNLVTLASPPKVSDTCGTSLAVSASCTIVYDYTVPSGSPDQLVNTVTAVYNSLAGLNGTEATGS